MAIDRSEFDDRHARLREGLRRAGFDAVVAYSNPKTRGPVTYLTGYFTLGVGANSRPDGSYYSFGSTALLFPVDDDPVLLTDIPFDLARARVSGVIPNVKYTGDLGGELGRLISARRYRNVGIDNWFIFPAVHYIALCGEAPLAKVTGTQLIQELYRVKSKAELELMRKAAEVAIKGMEAGFGAVRVGASEFEFALVAEHALRKHGELELAAVTVIAGGPNTATGTSSPTQTRSHIMRSGDWALFDLTPSFAGYSSDMARMVVAGRLADLDSGLRKMYEATREMNERVISSIRPGVTPKQLNEIAATTADEQGFGDRRSSLTGHGLGMDVHEMPDYHYDNTPLEENVCLTVEPSLIQPGVAATRIEDVVVVTRDGCDVLTGGFSRELRGTE